MGCVSSTASAIHDEGGRSAQKKKSRKKSRADSISGPSTGKDPKRNKDSLRTEDLQYARICALLCKYTCACEEDRVKIKQSLAPWSIANTEEWLIEEPQDGIVAMSGDLGRATDDSKEAIHIPFVVFVPRDSSDIVKEVKSNLVTQLETSNGHKIGKVSKRLYEYYSAFRDRGVVKWLVKNMDNKSTFLVGGHSAGGAIAALLATDLAIDSSVYHKEKDSAAAVAKTDAETGSIFYTLPDMKAFTFGAPRVFEQLTAEKLQKLQFREKVKRMVLEGDVVTTFPATVKGLQHCGETCFGSAAAQGWARLQKKIDFDGQVKGSSVEIGLAQNALDQYLDHINWSLELK